MKSTIIRIDRADPSIGPGPFYIRSVSRFGIDFGITADLALARRFAPRTAHYYALEIPTHAKTCMTFSVIDAPEAACVR